MSKNNTINPFDHSVVVIDEVHNLVSTISNQLDGPTNTVAMSLYKFIRTAVDARIVFLSGTPIINYPHEISILYNMIRGDVISYTFRLLDSTHNEKSLTKILEELKIVDRVEYSKSENEITITQNPYGFVKTNMHVNLDPNGMVIPSEFLKLIKKLFDKHNIRYIDAPNTIITNYHKTLPDTQNVFNSLFIDEETDAVKNARILSSRILGLTSYVSDLTHRMPKFDKNSPEYYIIVKIPMTLFQLNQYELMRKYERKSESKRSKRGLYSGTSSSYRIYSRLYCNYVFPLKDGKSIRPFLNADFQNISEDTVDAIDEDIDLTSTKRKYSEYLSKITEVKQFLWDNKETYLTRDVLLNDYSPKYAAILDNLQNTSNNGIHLLYSVFKTLEGLGLFSLFLDYNGFVEFKLIYQNSMYHVKIPDGISEEEFCTRPWYVKYTGDQSDEEKEILRCSLNSNWNNLPKEVSDFLKKKCGILSISENNYNGDVIKLFMITKSGAEGIDLKAVKFVHIMEPYWHPVRIEQVIGRARRIDSHIMLPELERWVKVFVYIMTINPEHLDKISLETKLHDLSKKTNRIMTTDESLYEIMERKYTINSQIARILKKSSFDCILHSNDIGEPCFTYGVIDEKRVNERTYELDITNDRHTSKNIENRTITARIIELPDPNDDSQNVKYAFDENTRILYDLEKYKHDMIVPIGRYDKDGTREFF